MASPRHYQVALDYCIEREAKGPTEGLIELVEPGSGDPIYAFCHSFDEKTGRETLLGARCSSAETTTVVEDDGTVHQQPNLNFNVPRDIIRSAVLHVIGGQEEEGDRPSGAFGWLVASIVFASLVLFYYWIA